MTALHLLIQNLLQDGISEPIRLSGFLHSQTELTQLFNPPFSIVALDKDQANDEFNLTGFSFIQGEDVVTNRLAIKSEEVNHFPLLSSLLQQLPQQIEVDTKDWPLGIIEQIPADKFWISSLVVEQQLVGFVITSEQHQFTNQSEYAQLKQCLAWLFANRQRYLQLETQMKAYQQVIDLMPQRVFWKNRKCVYMGANKAFAKDAGFELPKELVGLTDFDFFPEQADSYRRDDTKTMNERIHLINLEEQQTHKNGETIWLRTSKRPIVSSRNQVVGMVGTYDDNTNFRWSERAPAPIPYWLPLGNRCEPPSYFRGVGVEWTDTFGFSDYELIRY